MKASRTSMKEIAYITQIANVFLHSLPMRILPLKSLPKKFLTLQHNYCYFQGN
ncbi:UNVERIFIED_CONTAM: hypothetical protein FKN15_011156 [Acipenser sinensis]